ncbi:hypothetical protein AV530_001682 [Patagioenas fasciata monilis]|uniref:Uncharacterized protein n=1 Tax=Patagioenas fasciata monilis TaxID=372326 RepID=A0A1V4KLY1_PATFA|nr:hypothetical protein AV530_001682 [Patagioenas fasciata monilis]
MLLLRHVPLVVCVFYEHPEPCLTETAVGSSFFTARDTSTQLWQKAALDLARGFAAQLSKASSQTWSLLRKPQEQLGTLSRRLELVSASCSL